jgi:hypothetical protein
VSEHNWWPVLKVPRHNPYWTGPPRYVPPKVRLPVAAAVPAGTIQNEYDRTIADLHNCLWPSAIRK